MITDLTQHSVGSLASVLGVLGGAELRAALGFRTAEAFRAARRAGRVAVPLMRIEGRQGWFARVDDVARWQVSIGLPVKFEALQKGGHASTDS